jgi:hypothetical protein
MEGFVMGIKEKSIVLNFEVQNDNIISAYNSGQYFKTRLSSPLQHTFTILYLEN